MTADSSARPTADSLPAAEGIGGAEYQLVCSCFLRQEGADSCAVFEDVTEVEPRETGARRRALGAWARRVQFVRLNRGGM